jgi:hypothetical protein
MSFDGKISKGLKAWHTLAGIGGLLYDCGTVDDARFHRQRHSGFLKYISVDFE